MRLSEYQPDVIRGATAELVGPSVLLFGSRTRSDLRGGDIDLLVELSAPVPGRFALGNRLGARIERQLGLQKIDILITDPETPESPVRAEAPERHPDLRPGIDQAGPASPRVRNGSARRLDHPRPCVRLPSRRPLSCNDRMPGPPCGTMPR